MAKIEKNFPELIQIVERLRGPNGCPWDKEQTHQTLAPFALEEVFELVEAIELESSPQHDLLLKEELGDVLFQVILHSQLAKERGAFTISDVIQTLNEKMIRRHPHVFAETKVQDSAEVLKNWDQIKLLEKSTTNQLQKTVERTSPSGVPIDLPALQRAYKIGVKTKKTQFDWPDFESVLAKAEEEFGEFKEALQEGQARKSEELGDLFFALAQVARHLDIEPETCLRAGNRKFENRYAAMLVMAEQKGLVFENLSLTEKEVLWTAVKKAQKAKL